MTTGAAVRRRLYRQQLVPIAFGVACLIAVIALLEVLIRAGIVNRFIVPTPLDIAGSFGRIIREEHVGERFLLTCYEALGASLLLTVFGIAIGCAAASVATRASRHRNLDRGDGFGAARPDLSACCAAHSPLS